MGYGLAVVVLIAALCVPATAWQKPTEAEFAQRDKWLAQHPVPFSFRYGEQSSRDCMSQWKVTRAAKKLDAQRTQTTLSYVDPSSGLQVKFVQVVYADFPTVEWTVFFKNTGGSDTPVLSDILALDATLTRGSKGEFVLHRIKGDSCTADSYQPLEETLEPGSSKTLAPAGGRPTNGTFPYFNITQPGGGGIVAVSWAGQWSAEFERDQGTGLHIAAGQELTHFKLHPGEEARTPMIVMQFYSGDVTRAQNTWRRWMLAHNTPRPGGKPMRPYIGTTICGMFPGLMSSEKDAEQFGDVYFKEGLKLDFWNTDAGWYPCDPKVGWPYIGTWEPDPVRYPKGLKQLSDYVHKHDLKSMVWFEPERVHPGTWLAKEHPEWIHGGSNGGLLRLDLPECSKWLTEHIDSLLTTQDIDIYRQDFNIDPLPFWRQGEPEDRQGITENHHVTAYFTYWDELLKRHPNLIIDTCASGGRRNDLETMRRAVPFLRSDYQFEPTGNQGQTHGLSMWFPYQGTGNYQDSLYVHHSSFASLYGVAADIRKQIDWNMLRRTIKEWRQTSDLFLADYYPLTQWSLDNKEWIGFQFDSPEQGRGVVQAFRRPENKSESVTLKLQGLDSGAKYKLHDLSSTWTGEFTGAELMKNGLKLTVKTCPGDALILYTRQKT